MVKRALLGGFAFLSVVLSVEAIASDPRFYTEASFIYWKTAVNGLSYAIEESDLHSKRGKVRDPSFRWGPGVMVGLGYLLPHDEWKMTLQASSYRNHCTTVIHSNENAVLLPVWNLPLSSAESFTQVHQHYRLHLGLVDLLLSKSVDVTSHLDLTPFLGLSFGSVRQKYHLNYSQSTSLFSDSSVWRMKNKFEGLGSCLGCSGSLFLFKRFSLFALASIRLLYGEFYTHQGERAEQTQLKHLKLFNRFFSVAPVFSSTLGLRFQTPRSKSGKQWKVEVACDQMLFLAQNQLPHFMHSSQMGQLVANQGDLSLVGARLTGGFVF